MTPTFVEKMLFLHQALRDAEMPHAFGGALALAWCVEQARGTQDIDLNVFVDAPEFERVLGVLPAGVSVTARNGEELARDGQSRLWWDEVPVDLFLNTTPFHEAATSRVRWEEFAGADVPFLDCNDLAVFKAFFSRGKDWVDLAAMLAGGTLDVDAVVAVLAEYLGADDERIERLRNLQPEA
jgi:hypothetical protein